MRVNPEMETYMRNQHNMARDKGFITNPFGAFLLTPDVPKEKTQQKLDRNTSLLVEKQKKKALNFPIQSSNAFLLYEGLLRAEKLLKEHNLQDKVHFLFSVYDSFCYEVEDSVDDNLVLDILEKSFVCYLDEYYLGIDIEKGNSWGTTEGIKRDKRSRKDVHCYSLHK